MPVIKILPHPEYAPNGAEVKAPAGTSICEALLDNGIAIEHACEMSCACTTCHVVVRKGFESLNESDESEDDLLDRADKSKQCAERHRHRGGIADRKPVGERLRHRRSDMARR